MISYFWAAVWAVLLLLIPTAYAGYIGAPYAPTHRRAVRKAFDAIELGAGDVFVELGTGDGGILLEAAKRGARAYGYELSPLLWIIAKSRALFAKRVRVILGNFYRRPISDATVIFTFLMPQNMPALRAYLQRQTIPHGKYLLSYAFALPKVDPLSVVREKNCAPLYIYSLSELTKAGDESGS